MYSSDCDVSTSVGNICLKRNIHFAHFSSLNQIRFYTCLFFKVMKVHRPLKFASFVSLGKLLNIGRRGQVANQGWVWDSSSVQWARYFEQFFNLANWPQKHTSCKLVNNPMHSGISDQDCPPPWPMLSPFFQFP